MEKCASECDGGTSAPKKTIYMDRDSNPNRQKSRRRLLAAAPSVLSKIPLSTVHILFRASPALASPGSPEKPRRDSSTSMPDAANIAGVKKEFSMVLLKETAYSEGNQSGRGFPYMCRRSWAAASA